MTFTYININFEYLLKYSQNHKYNFFVYSNIIIKFILHAV